MRDGVVIGDRQHPQAGGDAEGGEDLAALGVTAGLDVLAVTDHNTVAHHLELPSLSKRFGIGLIPGQEVTTDTGHANAFGDIGVIDFRQPAATWVSEVARHGGLLSINHPLGGDCSWRHPLPEHPPLAEIWASGRTTPGGRLDRPVAGMGPGEHNANRR